MIVECVHQASSTTDVLDTNDDYACLKMLCRQAYAPHMPTTKTQKQSPSGHTRTAADRLRDRPVYGPPHP